MCFPVLWTRAGEHWVMYCNPCQASPEVPEACSTTPFSNYLPFFNNNVICLLLLPELLSAGCLLIMHSQS